MHAGYESAAGAENEATLCATNNLAVMLRMRGEHERADALLRRALHGFEARGSSSCAASASSSDRHLTVITWSSRRRLSAISPRRRSRCSITSRTSSLRATCPTTRMRRADLPN